MHNVACQALLLEQRTYPGLIEVEAWVPGSKVDDDNILRSQSRQLRKDVVPERGIVAAEAAHMNLSPIPELHIRPAGCSTSYHASGGDCSARQIVTGAEKHSAPYTAGNHTTDRGYSTA